MNYEDEDYVRYFTRDTVSWMALGWEGQAVLALMLHGKFDRSGVFDCDGHTPSHAVTLITRMPADVVEAGLKRLLDSKTWIHREGKLVWPKFVHAQGCRRSDRVRQRESREKRRLDALGQDVTPGDESTPAVTPSHTESQVSQPVTLSLAEPSRAEDPPTPLPVSQPVPANGRRKTDNFATSMTRPNRDRSDVLELFDDWKAEFGFPEAKLCVGIWNADADTLAHNIDAHGLEACKLVLKYAKTDGKVSGRTDEKREKHESINYIFENQNTFQRILRAAREAEKAKSSGGGFSSVIDQAKEAG